MSWLSGPCDPGDDHPTIIVSLPEEGPDGEPGEWAWVDSGAGPGVEFWRATSRRQEPEAEG